MVEPVARLGRFRWRCARRRRKQRINGLMSKTGHLVMHKVTPDHPLGQPLLILLVNHPAVGNKILLAPSKEFTQCDLLFAAAAFGMANSNNSFRLRRRNDAAFSTRKDVQRQLSFPDAVSAVTAVLLKYARFPVC